MKQMSLHNNEQLHPSTSDMILGERPRPLFIYGTLCALPLLAWAMTGEATRTADVSDLLQPAQVKGYKRVAVSHGDYPAAVESDSGSSISGMLLKPATNSQRRKLDDFEGEAYKVTPVQVTVQQNQVADGWRSSNDTTSSEVVEADIYVWNGDAELLTSEPWDLQTFINERLEDWLDLFEGMELIGED
jgi:gamma-glutamylcyclotransferase (GGCT)/AIG2-like uncharacterized protein YtfP